MKFCRIVSLFFCMLLLCSCAAGEFASDSETVALINGEAVTAEELEYFKSRERASVINYYMSEYAAEFDESFWETEFDGKTPAQELYDRAFEQCLMAKIQLVLCRENGIYEDISYAGLYKRAEQFNEENQNKQGAVGVTSISLDSFYTYYIDTGVMELKNILGDGDLKPDDDEISACMEEFGEAEENYMAAYKRAVSNKYDDFVASLREQAKIEIM